MFIPDVINTLLMGLIFMVVIVTIVRPFVLNMVGQAASNSDMQRAAIDAVEREMMRKAELFEAQRADKIKYQMLLLEKPDKPKPKPVVEPEPEPEVVPEPVAEVVPEVEEIPVAEDTPAVDAVAEAPVEELAQEVPAEAVAEETAAEAEAEEEALAEGEIEIREGESLAEIKERIRKEQQKAKKPTIPPELLNTANSYEDKVGVVRMVVQADQSRVASVIRGMIQVGK
jgi:outer membrane biosynthesis protein TonB